MQNHSLASGGTSAIAKHPLAITIDEEVLYFLRQVMFDRRSNVDYETQ